MADTDPAAVERAAYDPPGIGKSGFNCPSCRAFAAQSWYDLKTSINHTMEDYQTTQCGRCRGYALWRGGRLVYPVVLTTPPANTDLSDDIKRDYEEAREIVEASPRGAAALLRLAIEKLCGQLEPDGKDLNAKIGAMVKKGLDARVQMALDIVRVVGNEAVHPGTLDLRDDRETAARLFVLVNEIAEETISKTRRLEKWFGELPEDKRRGIAQRDSKSTT